MLLPLVCINGTNSYNFQVHDYQIFNLSITPVTSHFGSTLDTNL